MANLSQLKRTGARAKSRVGRGGKRGKTSGKGMKGQNSRAGRKKRPEMRDLIKKLPKRRGFGKNRARTVNPLRANAVAVSLATLGKVFDTGTTITPKLLAEKGIVSLRAGNTPLVKILGKDTVSKKFTISNCLISASAKASIEKAGGSVA